MSISGSYIAVRPFLYNGVQLYVGDTWQPIGARTDESIKRKLVRFVEETAEETPPPAKPATRRKRK